MTGPVTAQIQDLFQKHGLNPLKHQGLVTDLMKFTYDQMNKAEEAVLDNCRPPIGCHGSLLECQGGVHGS